MVDEIDDYGFTDTTTARKLTKLQEAIWQIEAMEPWPFLETTALLSFSGDSGVAFNFPTNFRAALKLMHVTKGYRIRVVPTDDADMIMAGNEATQSDPMIYYFEGMNLSVWPRPKPSDGLLKLRYLRWSDAITINTLEAAILIPKYYHEAIVLKALVALYVMEDDTDLAVGIENLFEDKIMNMRAALWQRQFDQPNFIHSVDAEEWDYEIV